MQVRVRRPIMRIPMLAIHLYREIYESGFKPNKQDHVTPVLATALKDQVNSPANVEASSEVRLDLPAWLLLCIWQVCRFACGGIGGWALSRKRPVLGGKTCVGHCMWYAPGSSLRGIGQQSCHLLPWLASAQALSFQALKATEEKQCRLGKAEMS